MATCDPVMAVPRTVVGLFFSGNSRDNWLGVPQKHQSPYGVSSWFVSEMELITQMGGSLTLCSGLDDNITCLCLL